MTEDARKTRKQEVPLSRITETTPLRLKMAANLAFPDGSMSEKSLRAEARKGRLKVWRVANRDFTTLAAITEMMQECLVKRSPRVFSTANERTDGSSSTAAQKQALDAALMTVQALKKPSRTTSSASTSRRSAQVVSLKP